MHTFHTSLLHACACAGAGTGNGEAKEQQQQQQRFLAAYFLSAQTGGHAVGRHYGFLAATARGRRAFVAALRRAARPLFSGELSAASDEAEETPALTDADVAASSGLLITFADFHSLLQLLCPDFPPAPVRHAWSAARMLDAQRRAPTRQARVSTGSFSPRRASLPGGGSGGGNGGSNDSGSSVCGCAALLDAFEATWLLEPFFVRARLTAASCLSTGAASDVAALSAALARAAAEVAAEGWPAPPAGALGEVAELATRGGARACSFGDVVRASCANASLRAALRGG